MPAPDAQDPRRCSAEDGAQEPEKGGRRPGLPDETTVVSEEEFTSPKGRRYRILKTRQTDPYDDPPQGQDKRP